MGKKGRPVSENSKNKGYRLRVNDEEQATLDYLSCKTGYPKSEILRKSLKMYYNLEKIKE